MRLGWPSTAPAHSPCRQQCKFCLPLRLGVALVTGPEEMLEVRPAYFCTLQEVWRNEGLTEGGLTQSLPQGSCPCLIRNRPELEIILSDVACGKSGLWGSCPKEGLSLDNRCPIAWGLGRDHQRLWKPPCELSSTL